MSSRYHAGLDTLGEPALIAAMNAARAALPVLNVLPPEDLPPPGALADHIGPARIAQAAQSLAHPRTGKPLSRLIPRQQCARIEFADVACNPRATDGRVHDAYFAVERVSAADPTVQFDGILAAVLALWLEAEDGTASRDDLTVLARGLALSFGIATGLDDIVIALPDGHAVDEDPLAIAARRWIRGHQIFLVLIQAMIQTVATLNAQAGAERRHTALDHLADLFDASAAAMRHTGNFDPAIYDRMVRPSMAPPYIAEGFSGLFSSDHRHLVQLLRSEGESLRQGAFGCPHVQQKMVTALGRLYDDHAAVCSRFVGGTAKSLLAKKDCDTNAIEQIEKFKKSRLRLISRA